jgi:transcriptional regulator with XRE-family HTH domain
MFREARNRAGLSREEASFRVHIGSRTLADYEHGVTTPPADVVLRMSEVYEDPGLVAAYCAQCCPIGQVFAHSVPDHGNLCQSVLGLLEEHNDVAQIRDNLVRIASDGVIDEDEIPIFKNIMAELLDLEKRIEELKLQAARIISIPAMMQKRKRPLQAAR